MRLVISRLNHPYTLIEYSTISMVFLTCKQCELAIVPVVEYLHITYISNYVYYKKLSDAGRETISNDKLCIILRMIYHYITTYHVKQYIFFKWRNNLRVGEKHDNEEGGWFVINL